MADVQQLFAFHFMQNAFLAGTLVAIVSGVVGHFMVLRSQSFAGHALAHVSFAGATGAALIGLSPVAGLIGFAFAAAMGISLLGMNAKQFSRQDVAVGIVLAFGLGVARLPQWQTSDLARGR